MHILRSGTATVLSFTNINPVVKEVLYLQKNIYGQTDVRTE